MRQALIALTIISVLAAACTREPPVTAPPETPATTEPEATPRIDPRAAVARFLAQPDAANRIAAALSLDSADGPTLSALLHAAASFSTEPAGRRQIAAPIGFNQNRLVTVRTPPGYDPAIAWPLIVAYHSWGGTGDRMIDRLEALLGPDIDRFVVAAPDEYRQTVIDAPPPVSSEHISVWTAVMSRWHVDANRVHVMGYSLGGETVMTSATMHGHRLASGIGWASTPALPPDVEGMWEWFAPNLRTTAILHVWGSEDTFLIPGLNGRRSEHRLDALNRSFAPIAAAAGLERYIGIEIAGADHGTTLPPLEDALAHLAVVRGPPPIEITHTFRYIHQADTAWVEGHEWEGDAWLEPWPTPEIESGSLGPSEEAAVICELLGSIDATAHSNVIEVDTAHLADFTIWLLDGVVDLDLPITVIHNGAEVFSGFAPADAEVALAQAVRTRDFDRLRWAGIRIVDGSPHLVGGAEEFPPVVRGITLG